MKVRTETVWRTEAAPDRAWEILADYARWPTWWAAIRSVELLDPGDRRGVGSRLRQSWRGRIPVPIAFDLTIWSGSSARRSSTVERVARSMARAAGSWWPTGQAHTSGSVSMCA